MRALDLCCGAGGASRGLEQAGFGVEGWDHREQPNYPYPFRQRDLRDLHPDDFTPFDLIWASPPCQAFTAYRRRPGHVRPARDWIAHVRALLEASGKPFIIENVPGAPLLHPITLCGSMFALDVRRHRWFETSFPTWQPACDHTWQRPRFPPATNRPNRRATVEIGVWRIPLAIQHRAMGIDWMTREELSQAIPPAYARWLGLQARRGLTPYIGGC